MYTLVRERREQSCETNKDIIYKPRTKLYYPDDNLQPTENEQLLSMGTHQRSVDGNESFTTKKETSIVNKTPSLNKAEQGFIQTNVFVLPTLPRYYYKPHSDVYEICVDYIVIYNRITQKSIQYHNVDVDVSREGMVYMHMERERTHQVMYDAFMYSKHTGYLQLCHTKSQLYYDFQELSRETIREIIFRIF